MGGSVKTQSLTLAGQKMQPFSPEGPEIFLVGLCSKILKILTNFQAHYKGQNFKSLKPNFLILKSQISPSPKAKTLSPSQALKIPARPTSR
jgi:hypothetical protein